MTPALTPLSALLLALSWPAAPGITYTIQTSADLEIWETLPFVISGDGSFESHSIEMTESVVFARLQFSADGDTDGNGLPDLWEWTYFGHLNVDPNADPDEDDVSTYFEWLDLTDPRDFFNGEFPVIRISSGDQWFVRAGEVSTQMVSVSVSHPSGEPWADAPLDLFFESGYAGIISDTDSPELALSSTRRWTDSLGRLNPDSSPINLLGPAPANQSETFRIAAGHTSKTLFIRSIGSDMGPPPRRLNKEVMANGDLFFSWTGSAEGANGFFIEEQNVSGNWIQIARLEPSEYPSPDPTTGEYSLLLAASAN